MGLHLTGPGAVPASLSAPAYLPGQACTKQGWLRSWSRGQLPLGRAGRSSSRRWKVRPRPQLRLQPLQPDQGASTQSTAGDGCLGVRGRPRGGGASGQCPSGLARTTAILVRAILAVGPQVTAPLRGQALPAATAQLALGAERPGGWQSRQGRGGHREGYGACCP